MVDISSVLGRSLPGRAPRIRVRARALDAELVAVVAVLGAALSIGLLTASDYGLSVDEFNTDDYGPKALAWYTSGFADRSHFETVEQSLWMYGPWFQMLTAFVQSLHLTDPITTRHALTFVVGLAGLAAVVPIARLTIGRWAGLAALVLCLLTGYLYGSLFFAPIDVPFLFAMSWSTLAIIVMARRPVPGWGATVATGLFTGLAIATRTGGIITHAYLVGAMSLSALAAVCTRGQCASRVLPAIALRTADASSPSPGSPRSPCGRGSRSAIRSRNSPTPTLILPISTARSSFSTGAATRSPIRCRGGTFRGSCWCACRKVFCCCC